MSPPNQLLVIRSISYQYLIPSHCIESFLGTPELKMTNHANWNKVLWKYVRLCLSKSIKKSQIWTNKIYNCLFQHNKTVETIQTAIAQNGWINSDQFLSASPCSNCCAHWARSYGWSVPPSWRVQRPHYLDFRRFDPSKIRASLFQPLRVFNEVHIVKSSWWLNQSIWKICLSKWVHLPQIEVKIRNMFETTT